MKRFLSILLSVAMVMSMMPMAFAESVSEDSWDFTTETVETADEAVQGTETELAADDEVSYSTDGGSTWTTAAFDTVWSETAKSANWGKGYQIKVLKDFSLTTDKEYSLSYGVKVTIYADTDVTITVPTSTKIIVKSGGQYNGGDAILTFGKSGAAGTVTFDGKNKMFSEAAFRAEWSSGSYMGHLVINDGVSIKNFKRSQGGTYYGIIYNNGQLDINGGSITNNEISSNTVDSVIFNCRKLNIAGGEISNNSITSSNGYIVMVRSSSAELTMTGGKIVSNNVKNTVMQIAQDDVNYQGTATITAGTIANNKANSYSDNDFTAEAKDISIGASLTKLALNGTAEIGTIETSTNNITNSKFITIASGFAPATPISVLVSMSYIGGQVYPSEGMQVATVEDGASINGKLVYYNTDFSISDDGKLAGPPEVEATYSYYQTGTGDTSKTISGTLKDVVTQMKKDNAYNQSTITVLKDIALSETILLTNTWTIKSKDGETHTFTRADGFTGPMIRITGGVATPTIGSENGKLIFDGQNSANMDPLISINDSGSKGATLQNLELKNNNAENGGAIYTTDAVITATNVTISNCSSVNGGAIYWSLADTNSEEVTLTNSIIKSNTADTGSAIFIKNDNNKWGQLVLNGCTFENNTFSNSASNTDGHTKSTTIYFDNAAATANQYNYISLNGATTFDNNTNSDIMLDNGLATSTTYANIQTQTGFANKGQAIKIAVGSFSRNNTTETYVVKDSGMTTDVFKLVGTYANSDTGDYQLKRTNYYYLSIQAPAQIALDFYGNGSTSYNAISKFNNKIKEVQLSVSPSFEVNTAQYDSNYALENKNYTITVTANDSVAITDMYIAYSKGSVEKNEYATVSADKKSATFTLTTDTLSTIVAGATNSIPTCKIYVEYQTLAQAITVVQSTGGTISATPSDKAAKGDTVTLTATPDAEYNFSSWNVYKTGDTSAKVTVSGNTFAMPSYPVTVSATFVKKTHAVTVEIQGETAGGAVSINKTSPVTVGEKVQVTVDTNAHYVLASLTMNDTDIMSSKSFTMPNKAVTITAGFEKTKHELEYVESPLKGKIQGITPNKALPWGTVLKFTVTPNSYYVIDHVVASFKGGSTIIPQGADGKYTYTTTPADTTIQAVYKKQQFTVTANETQNGTIKLISTSPIDWGDDFTINVKADPNYEIDTVTVDGETVSVNNLGDYTFVMPTRDVTVSATFKKIKYTITGEGNNVTFGIPDKSTYNWGDTVEITATPDMWYSIKNVYAKDNSSVTVTKVEGEENTYSFVMPTSNITIVAAAERPNFTVTFNSQGGSAVTPATVANGAALTKPAAPSWAGRGFAGWYTDAACTQKYDFTKHVTGDLTLYARWFLWGDVNNDGTVDSYDALLIRRCRAGLTDYSLIENRLAGFVNGFEIGRNYPDSGDAVSIRRFRAGLINRYKVEDGAAGYEFDLENDTYIPKN